MTHMIDSSINVPISPYASKWEYSAKFCSAGTRYVRLDVHDVLQPT